VDNRNEAMSIIQRGGSHPKAQVFATLAVADAIDRLADAIREPRPKQPRTPASRWGWTAGGKTLKQLRQILDAAGVTSHTLVDTREDMEKLIHVHLHAGITVVAACPACVGGEE
jgi:hypothetical protein